MKPYIFIGIFFITVFTFAQDPYLRINQDSISLTDFKKEYAKNIEAEGFDRAVKTYIDFALILEEANKTQVDTTSAFWGIYRESMKPTFDQYILNESVTEKLLPEVMHRFQNDRKIEIYGINVQNPYNSAAKAEDVAFMDNLRKNACNQATATEKVKTYLAKNKVSSIWVRPFKINRFMEKLAYATPVGACSEIQEYDNKIFFIKVVEERPNLGTFKVEYITTGHKVQAVRAYNSITDGEKWQRVRNNYKNRKRIIKKVYEHDTPQEIYYILSQMEEGDISQPFEYEGYWHIIKLLYHDQCKDVSGCKDWLVERLQNSDYKDEYMDYVQNIANQKVNIHEDTSALNEVLKAMGDDFFQSEKQVNFMIDKPIWKTPNTKFTQYNLIEKYNRARKILGDKTNFQQFTDDNLPKFKDSFILNEYINYTESYEPEYEKVSTLLKNSIKIHHYLENEVYYEAMQDTIGMQNYMNSRAKDFTWPVRYDMKIYRYNKDEYGKKVVKMLKEGKTSTDILKEFKDVKAENNALEVFVTKGKFTQENPEIFSNFNPEKNIQFGTFRNKKAVYQIIETLPPGMMTIKEAGKALTDAYKDFYYQKTLKKLEDNATISLPVTFKP